MEIDRHSQSPQRKAMTDTYTFWRRALAGHKDPIHDGDPQPGFYRRRSKDGVDDAVAYWWSNGQENISCLLNGKLVPAATANELWSFVCNKPVRHDAYTFRMEK